MTGKIKSIGLESGYIHIEDGRDTPFKFSNVLAYDLATLAVDQCVTFDIGRGSHAQAVNIVVQKQTPFSPSEKKSNLPCSFRYLGFEHSENCRAYRFEEVIPGGQNRTFIVKIDTALFKRHRVGMQEGPALCLRLLMEETDIAEAESRSIDEHAMLVHAARRPVPKTGSRARNFSYTPGSGVRAL